jgi:tetratricopeptide (TPR) repeat protein
LPIAECKLVSARNLMAVPGLSSLNNMRVGVLIFVVAAAMTAVAQDSGPITTVGPRTSSKTKASAPPRSDDQPESSSKDTKIDLAPPKGDSSAHPNSGAVADDVLEMHPYNPMKAMKDVEVGDYHFKRQNYPAAISRYREALEYKPHDAIATFGLAQALEKSGDVDGARGSYEDYLKILPNGPQALECRKALQRLNKASASSK